MTTPAGAAPRIRRSLRRARPATARARLTALYAGLFALSGLALAGLLILLTLTPLGRSSTVGPADKLGVVKSDAPAQKIPAGGTTTAAQQAAEEFKAQARRELRNRLVTASMISVAAMTVVSAGLGWLVAGRVLRPVHAMSATARRLSQRDLHRRLPVSEADDELRELAETINLMLGRLERAFEAQRRFAGNASHELRGPLATVRALVDVAAAAPDASVDLRELAAELRVQVERQHAVIEGLLELASSEHGPAEVRPVRLDELVRLTVDELVPEITALGLRVDTTLAPSTVDGDPVLLRLLVANLLRNAVRHNVPGGEIRIELSGALTITNTGADVTAERLRQLVEPFRSGARDRTGGAGGGAGLGLAIAETVVRSHGGELAMRPRDGGGIVAVLSLPATAVDPADPRDRRQRPDDAAGQSSIGYP